MSEHFQIVVVGGGPVGVGLGVALGLRGISCAVIEPRETLSRIPKGQNLTQRTMFFQLLDGLWPHQFGLGHGKHFIKQTGGQYALGLQAVQALKNDGQRHDGTGQQGPNRPASRLYDA